MPAFFNAAFDAGERSRHKRVVPADGRAHRGVHPHEILGDRLGHRPLRSEVGGSNVFAQSAGTLDAVFIVLIVGR